MRAILDKWSTSSLDGTASALRCAWYTLHLPSNGDQCPCDECSHRGVPKANAPAPFSCGQEGGCHWLQLVTGSYRVLATPGGRLCGTPGCKLRDFHDGACSTEWCTGPRRPAPTLPKARRRSPRLLPKTFPWDSLDIDLQASVIVQLACDTADAMRLMARLARELRPLRPAILHALRLHIQLRGLLNVGWDATTCKFAPSSSVLTCNWRDAHASRATTIPLDERVNVELRLRWDVAAPRRWRWTLRLTWDVATPGGASLRAASFEAVLSAVTRVGVPPVKGRSRRHSMLCGVGSTSTATLRQMDRLGACWCHRSFGNLEYMQVSTENGLLRLVCGHTPLVVWKLTREALSAMDLVGALM